MDVIVRDYSVDNFVIEVSLNLVILLVWIIGFLNIVKLKYWVNFVIIRLIM